MKHQSKAFKSSISIFLAAAFVTMGGFSVQKAEAAPQAVLGVTQITAVQTFATADDTYPDGWKWVFDVTVPADQTLLQMKFADWTNSSGIIPAGGNIQFYSAQSTNAPDEAHAIPITASSTLSDIMDIDPGTDLDVLQGGRQIEITVEARIPTGSAGGSYSTSYGIKTTAISTVTLGDLTQTYDGTPKPVSTTTDPLGLPVSVTYDGSATAPTHAGAYDVEAVVTDPNYTGTSSATLTIEPASVTVTADPQTKVYGTADPALTYGVIPPLFGSDVFTGALSRDPGEDVGSYAIASGTLAVSGDYAISFISNSLTITPASTTVTGLTAENKPYDGTTAATIDGTPALLGIIGTDDVTLSGTPTGAFADKDVGTDKPVTISGLSLSGTAAGNYTLDALPTLEADITASPITVTAVMDTKTYDASTSSAGIPTITSGSLANGDTATWSQTFDTKDVGTGKTLTPSGTISDGNGGADYSVTFVPETTGAITPATATVSATGHDKVYDGTTAATVDLSVTGAVGDDVLTAHDTAAFADKDVGSDKPISVSGITLSGAAAGDYDFNTTADAFAAITPATLTITATDETKVYGDTLAFAGTEFTTSGLLDDDACTGVTLNSDGAADTATVSGSPYEIVPSDAICSGLANYNVDYANGQLTVTSKAAIVSVDDLDQTYDGTPKSVGTSTIPTGLSVSVTYDGSLTPPTKAGTYAVVATITDPNYTGSAVGSLMIAPLSITAKVTASNKIYDGTADATSTCSLVGAVGGDSAGCTATGSFADKNVGIGKAVSVDISLTGPDAGNYTINPTATTNADITPLAVTVTAQTNTKTYDGDTSAAATPTVAPGLATGDSSSFIETYDTPHAGTGKTLTPSGTISDGNGGADYSVTFVPETTGAITKADQTITFVSFPTGVISGDTFTVTATSTSGLPITFTANADILPNSIPGLVFNVCEVGSNGLVTLVGPGTCPVTAEQPGDGDYDPAPDAVKDFIIQFTVSQAHAEASFDGQSTPSQSSSSGVYTVGSQ